MWRRTLFPKIPCASFAPRNLPRAFARGSRRRRLNFVGTWKCASLSKERVFEELSKALLKADRPSIFFESLREMEQMHEFFPEIEKMIGVPQNPQCHPEGDVFRHTMLVVDQAASLRDPAKWPLAFMLSALCHDLGKIDSTEISPDGQHYVLFASDYRAGAGRGADGEMDQSSQAVALCGEHGGNAHAAQSAGHVSIQRKKPGRCLMPRNAPRI